MKKTKLSNDTIEIIKEMSAATASNYETNAADLLNLLEIPKKYLFDEKRSFTNDSSFTKR